MLLNMASLLISGFPNRNTACLKQLVTQHAHNHAGCDFGTPTLKKRNQLLKTLP